MAITLPQRTPCPFCENLSGRYPCAFIRRDELVASFINPRQYEHGSVLIIPTRHAPTMLDLTPAEVAALYQHAQQITEALSRAYDPIGFNIFQNNGIAAGQSVAHFHIHVVPRYEASDPNKIFRHQELASTPFEERLPIVAAIAAHL